MIIITNIRCYVGYPLISIDPTIQKKIRKLLRPVKAWSLLIRLECYLQITNQTLDSSNLFKKKGKAIIRGFAAALFSNRFHDLQQPWDIGRNLRIALNKIVQSFPTTLNREKWSLEFANEVNEFEQMVLNEERIEFWKGWITYNQNGALSALVFWPIYERYGARFARDFQKASDQWNRRRRLHMIKIINDFAYYIGNYPETLDLLDSSVVEKVIKEYFKHFFISQSARGTSITTLNNYWVEFTTFLKWHVFGKILAKPSGVIPQPNRVALSGIFTNLGINKLGSEVKTCLITEIPLQLTDSDAKEILFSTIRLEVQTLLVWARAEIAEAKSRLENRRALSSQGIPSIIGKIGENTGKRARLNRINPESLAHAAATFELYGYKPIKTGQLIYPTPLSKTAWELAIPSPQLLLAHATVLVATHPIITTSFLDDFEMYNINGEQIGLINTDAGSYLVGYKRRKGPNNAQQKILLTSETLAVINDLIELTDPLRKYLRSIGDDNWKLLFISTGSMSYKPAPWNASKHAARHSNWISERLQILTGIDFNAAKDLAERFSLKRLRSSAAVLIYIDSESVEKMAKALGHDRLNSTLLDHYLPKPIQDFFVERWIRIFQTGLICEVMKDSPYLQYAAGFESIIELNQFLENHALKKIPSHLQNSCDSKICKSDDDEKVIFGIDIGILTILMSLIAAAKLAILEPCGRALYWIKIGNLLIDYLETQKDRPEFRDMLIVARTNSCTTLGEKYLYG